VALIMRFSPAGSYRRSICRLSMLLLLASWSAAHAQSSPWDKRDEYRQAGYTELTGADAARFLVGNSVIVPELKEGTTTVSLARIYYFLGDYTMYDCGMAAEGECEFESWSIRDDGICSQIGACAKPFAVFRSANWQEWERRGGQLGIYLTDNHVASEIVKGNWTNGPLFDTRVSGRVIELNRADFPNEAAEAVQFNLPDGQISIRGSRALSLLIGNTFLSKDVEAGFKDKPEEICPQEGEYYSPDGLVLHFNCNAKLNSWSFAITRWHVVSGMMCRDDLQDIGKFGCNSAAVSAIPTSHGSGANENGASEKMRVLNHEVGGVILGALTGYSGNIFNFRFDSGHK
jgi:hypothetical protein